IRVCSAPRRARISVTRSRPLVTMAETRIDGVIECSVIAAPDEKFGETPAAIVHGSEGLTEEAVIEECQRVLSSFKVPSYVVLRPDPLPRLPNGKISKVDIRNEYADLTERFAKAR
ncbi:AMP-binding enzyme, partial [Nocardia salmonicida]|uniref:AMP-binding enzyme n=1 Tax=Nocardia salmonicida TaxID=53431 RepID=UPI003495F68F